jgi:hypothetical protein
MHAQGVPASSSIRSGSVGPKTGHPALDELTVRAINAAGVVNILQLRYVKQVAEVLMADSSESLISLKPVIRIAISQAWTDALRLAIAFLKRYRLTQTLATVRTEYPEAPKTTGYGRVSEVDAAFADVLDTSDDLADLPFDEKVAAFTEELNENLAREEPLCEETQ